MMSYSVQPRGRILVKGYGFLSFAKNLDKNIGKNVSKNISGKYSQKLPINPKQSATDALKTSSKRVIQNTAEATGDLVGNNIANTITKVSKNSQQINSETVTNEHDKEILNKYLKKYIYIHKKGTELLMT